MSEPASTLTYIGNQFKFQIGAGNSPETFTDFCAIFDAGNLGEVKPLIDVTSLCDQARTFRSGLSDGASITLKANFLQGDALIHEMYQAFKANTIKNYRLEVEVSGSSPGDEYFEFAATITGWNVLVPVGAKAEVNFTLKITGPVTWHYISG